MCSSDLHQVQIDRTKNVMRRNFKALTLEFIQRLIIKLQTTIIICGAEKRILKKVEFVVL